MAIYDAQLNNESTRGIRIYSDLDLFFGKKSSDRDISVVTDVNLVLLNTYEKPFHPEISSGVRDMLFELMTPVTAAILGRQIENVIENFEPRARLVGVRTIPDYDRNSYEVTVEFYVVNTPTELVDLTIFLERLR
jgi:phage baseplate assembly protein W